MKKINKCTPLWGYDWNNIELKHSAYNLLKLHPNIMSSWESRSWSEQMDAGRYQLCPVSQVTTLAIVTSRLKPHAYIPRSCSGSVGSCPFTFTPTNDLGAKHDVITPIWQSPDCRTGKWRVVSFACVPRQGYLNKGHDLPLSATDLWLFSHQQTFVVDSGNCVSEYKLDFIHRLLLPWI